MLIDSHCHLDTHHLPAGPDAVIERAIAAGVGGLVCVGVGGDPAPARFAVALAERRADVVAVVGLHPHEASAGSPAFFDELASLVRRERVIAVGEIGLDYHYDFSPRDVQREVFRRMIALAHEVKKPIVIHTREASDDTLQILEDEGARALGGVFHCFSEDVAFARKALDLGFDISLSGIVTFPKATALHEVARFVPSDRYYVETDSPYLAPVPFRGKKCEPAYVAHTARRIAELRGVAFEQVAQETSANVIRRFGLSRDTLGGFLAGAERVHREMGDLEGDVAGSRDTR
ncbi:MAG: TatD family hydrolase [Deltaproteobacteria bacterium]|nr:TatD family hydrolase [Deltaproteobacteria bacterium]